MQQQWIDYLKRLVSDMKTPTMFLIATGDDVLTPEVPTVTPTDDQAEYCFQLGRDFAKSHPTTYRQANITQIRIGQQDGKELVLASMMDEKTGEVNSIPYRVIRTRGKITELRDDGDFITVVGAFLPAFYVGMRTAHLSETEALRRLDQELTRLATQLATELKKRMPKSGQ